jgi:predicted lipoprotein with Yx(FWY)xxD motif
MLALIVLSKQCEPAGGPMDATRRIVTAVALVGGLMAGAAGVAEIAHGDETTISADQARDGWDPNEPGLSPAVVGGGTFGQLFSTAVSGQIYAQPLAVGGSVIVATENDWVYSLNAETGAIDWSLSLGNPWPNTVVGCEDMKPDIGVTSTPVYDPATGTVYVVAELDNAANAYAPGVDLFAIDAASGAIDWKTPVQGAPVNEPTRPFDPLTERQRASLLLLNGTVYMGFGSYCDFQPYVGYVAGVNTTTHALTMWTDESGTTDSRGGIWQSNGGLMSDGTDRIFLATGNGVSPAPGSGTSPPGELGDSVVRLGVQTGGSLAAKDFFAPANAPVLAAHDQDLGSGGPVALPFGTAAHPHLLMEAGKDGRIFLLDRDSLGGRNSTTDHPVYVTPIAYAGQGGHPAAFAGAGGADYLYYHGGSDFTRAFKFNTSTAALTDAGHTPDALRGGSGSPVVTSNGTDPASAVVWEVNRGVGSQGTLEAFDAIPNASGQLTMIWSQVIGAAIKFAVPATDSGRVYVGTLDGHVLGFGAPDKAPLSGTPVAFGQLAVGSSSCGTVTVTATAPVTVTGVTASSASAPDPFTVDQPNGCAAAVTFPQTLTAAGQTLTVPVTFAPTAPGGATAALAFATTTHDFSTVDVSVSGTGTQTGLYASTSSLEFGSVPTGSTGSEILQTVITNGGTKPETVTTTTAPTGPFSASGLPARGTPIQPGGSVTVSVTFKPTAAGGDTGSLSVTGSSPGGTVATVSLAGTGVTGRGTLSASPASASFGSVALGQQHTQTVTIANTGNLPMTISAFSAPTVPFGTPVPVTTGITLGPGDTAVLPVTFTPQSLGAFGGTYTLTASDGHNPAQKLTIPVAGRGAAPASGVVVPSPGGGWTVNGSAHFIGTTLRLTPAVNGKIGSAVYSQPLTSNGLQATFTARIGGGTGADGLTFAMLDATKATTTSRGNGANKLGFGGLPGVAVALDTFPRQSVGIVTGQTATGLIYAAKTTNVPNLRSGAHVIGVTVTGSRIVVTVDGKTAVTASVPLPPTVLAAFTGANGGLADDHDVSGVSIHTGAVRLPPPGGGWSYNRSALMAGPDTQLTTVSGGVGSVVYPAPVASNGLRVRFNLQIGGGTGADGMTFAMLSPTTPNWAIGSAGAGLGFAHLSGVAVVFDTHQVTGYPSSNFAGIATGVTSSGVLKLTSSVNEIGQLRAGTHTVQVIVNGGVLVVYFDGAQILAQNVTLPRTVKLAFTAGSGNLTDMHTVRDAGISVGAPASSAGAVSPGRAPTAPAATPAPPLPTIEVLTSNNYSEVLTTPAGMTLYRQIASCSACAARYQPLLIASGQPLHMPPLLPGQLGTVRLPDGSLQLTYDGVRLYTYSGDHSPGDTNGVSLAWNVVQPES